MVRLKELHLSNFRSWRELHLTDLDNKGLCLILGKNGAGKSSIRQAIEYGLVDTTAEKLSVGDLPFDCDSECRVNLVLDKDGDRIEITKYRNHKEEGNRTYLSINGDIALTQTDRRDTQREIEKLLGINSQSLFISTTFSQYSPSFLDSKETDRKKILYPILNLTKYETFFNTAKNKYDELVSTITNLNSEITRLEHDIKEFDIYINKLNLKSKEYIASKNIKLETLNSNILSIKFESTNLIDEEIKRLKSNLVPENTTGFASTQSDLLLQIRLLEEKIKSVEGNICPITNSKCDTLEKESIKRDTIWIPELDILNKKFLHIETIINRNKENKASNERVSSKISELQSDKKLVVNNNENFTERKESLFKRIKELVEEKNPYLEFIKTSNTSKQTAVDKIIALKAKITDLSDDIKYYDFWKTGYSKKGIPNIKSEGFLSSLEVSINTTLSKISTDSIFVKIEAQSEDDQDRISYKIFHPHKKISDPRTFSGGERQRTKIADIFAFSEQIGIFNMMFFDEALDLSLDSNGKSDVIELLQSKAEELGTIFVVSHSKEIVDRFDNIIKIINEDGESKLDEKNI